MNKEEIIKELEAEGYTNIREVNLAPGQDPGLHTHEKNDMHVIISGQITASDENGSTVLKPGDRMLTPAGTTHTGTLGPEGVTMIVGEK